MAKRKLAEVKISHSYIVYADDEEMTDEAKNALYEDLMNAVKYNELFEWIKVEAAPRGTQESDIPECFLQSEDEDGQ